MPASKGSQHSSAEYTVLLYSHDSATRGAMRMAIGRRPAPDLGTVEFIDATTADDVIAAVDAGSADVLVLDAEAWPAGGMGIARQLTNETENVRLHRAAVSRPPVVLLLARSQDRWLAAWSQADAVIAHPLDPVEAACVVAEQLRVVRARLVSLD